MKDLFQAEIIMSKAKDVCENLDFEIKTLTRKSILASNLISA
jgi:hypothetical protein